MDDALINSRGVKIVDETVGTRFARQVVTTPDSPAIITADETVTFRQLELKCNRIATALASNQVGSEEPLALIMPEGALRYAVMLAVAKLGRIFVPLDATMPEAWLSEIIVTSGARNVLTDQATHAIGLRIAGRNAMVLESEQLKSAEQAASPDSPVSADAILCVLYTSGSTGRPKGVAISHRSMLHRAAVRGRHCGIRTTDRIAHLRSSNFAGGVHDLFSTFLNGAALCPYDVKKRGLPELSPWLVARRITALPISSSILRAWLQTMPEDFRLPELRLVVAASEALYGADVARLARHLQGNWEVVHQLSSTEAGTIADQTYGPSSEMDEAILPVGRTVEDFEIRLEDENGNLAGPGEAGEIIVGSRYLARGYWKDALLTAERFVPDPADPSKCYFRTGDLGRWRNDGFLEFFGRKDRKIKLRGYSIELYEVEQALLRLPGVRDAVVVVEGVGSDDKRLVGYVASDRYASAESLEIRTELFSKLPSYMVPSKIVVLESIPLTPRGKVDRNALSSIVRTENRKEFATSSAPLSDVERRLAQIWKEVLKGREIRPDDDFFVMGGDSLQATQLILQVEKLFGVALQAEVMFGKASTITGMALEIEKARSSAMRGTPGTGTASSTALGNEIDVDFAEFQRPVKNKSVFFIDPRTGLRRAKPNSRYRRVIFNSQGYRNPEVVVPKPPGTTRVAFLGASTTCDTFVSSTNATWPHVTCEILRTAFPDATIDYVNGGLTGFNTRRLIVLFREYISAFNPDAVVIFSSDHNADSNYLARKQGLYHGAHFQPSWLAKRSSVWHAIEKNLTILARLLRAQRPGGKLNFSSVELTSDFEGRLQDLVRLCQQTCPVVVLLTTAGRLRRSQSKFERIRSAVTNVFFMPYMSIDGLLDAYDAFDDAIRKVGKLTGALVIEPKAAVPGDAIHFVDSSHFRDAGSKCMAGLVANSLANYPQFRSLVAGRPKILSDSPVRVSSN